MYSNYSSILSSRPSTFLMATAPLRNPNVYSAKVKIKPFSVMSSWTNSREWRLLNKRNCVVISLDITRYPSASPRADINIARDDITPVCVEEVAFRMHLPPHRQRKGLKVGGAEVPVVAAKVDPRCGGLGAQPPDTDEDIIFYNSKVAPK